MKFTDMAQSESNYLKAEDLQGREVQVVIDRYTQEEMEDRKGNTETKWVVWFRSKEKGLVLNKTNAETLGKIFNNDSAAAIGQPIVLWVMENAYQGKPGIRVRAVAAPEPEQVPF